MRSGHENFLVVCVVWTEEFGGDKGICGWFRFRD